MPFSMTFLINDNLESQIALKFFYTLRHTRTFAFPKVKTNRPRNTLQYYIVKS